MCVHAWHDSRVVSSRCDECGGCARWRGEGDLQGASTHMTDLHRHGNILQCDQIIRNVSRLNCRDKDQHMLADM